VHHANGTERLSYRSSSLSLKLSNPSPLSQGAGYLSLRPSYVGSISLSRQARILRHYIRTSFALTCSRQTPEFCWVLALHNLRSSFSSVEGSLAVLTISLLYLIFFSRILRPRPRLHLVLFCGFVDHFSDTGPTGARAISSDEAQDRFSECLIC
jgi:hypothetical protein